MLYCGYCDFLEQPNEDIEKHNDSFERRNNVCRLTNYIFEQEFEDLDIEYPCAKGESNKCLFKQK